jgi:hypothetical protein
MVHSGPDCCMRRDACAYRRSCLVRTGPQEQHLFSWRLLLIDAVLMFYLFCIFVASLALSLNVTRPMVANALFKYVGPLAGCVSVSAGDLRPLCCPLDGML